MRSYLTRLACVAILAGVAAPAQAIDPKLLMPNAEVAVNINLKQILDSDLMKAHKDLVDQAKSAIRQKLDESPAKDYLDKAGFDIFQDFHSITMSGDGSKETESGLVAIQGKFNPDKLVEVAREAAAKEGDKLKVTKAGNVNVFEITPKENEKTIYAGLIGDSLIVAAATREQLNAAIARIAANKTPTFGANFKQVLSTTNDQQSFVMVASAEGIAKMSQNAPKQPGGDFNAMLQSVEGMSLSLSVAKDINFQAAAATKAEDDAKKIASSINGLLAIGRGMIANQAKQDEKLQPVAEIMNSIRVTVMNANVAIRGEVSRANLDKMLSMIPKSRNQ